MAQLDYFDEKISEAVTAVVGRLVEEWKGQNPFDPDLQASIGHWGDEFLAYVSQHVPVSKRPFALGGHNGDDRLRVFVDISRIPGQAG